MDFARGDVCYILENNMNVRAAKVINKQGRFYTIQLVGSCGAIRPPESRLFASEGDAENSKKLNQKIESSKIENDYGFIDVFEGRRSGKSPH